MTGDEPVSRVAAERFDEAIEEWKQDLYREDGGEG
jgi:hypothetical protein